MISRLFRYSVSNIFRNTFLSISSVLILTLLIFFINILVVLHDVSIRLIDGINEKLTISLYLQDGYDKNSVEIIDLQNDIHRSIPEIDIAYKTKDEVLEELRAQDPELVKILERQNPLPETITLTDIPLSGYNTLNRIIENKLFVLAENTQDSEQVSSDFSSYTSQFQRIEKVIGVLGILQMGLYIIIVTFVISIAIIIYSIIGNFIYYYRDEIYITRLVGGSKVFIYGPFCMQGVLYIMCAFIISVILFLLLLSNASILLEFTNISEIFPKNLALILFTEAIVFIIIGAMSGFISSKKYLKT